MKKEEQFLLWFEQLERKDVDIVGGKSSSLGEMTAKTDVPVPYGFATTAYAYRYFIKESGLEEKMRSILSELTDVENSALLRDVSARLRDAIMAEKMPQDLHMLNLVKESAKRIPMSPFVPVLQLKIYRMQALLVSRIPI